MARSGRKSFSFARVVGFGAVKTSDIIGNGCNFVTMQSQKRCTIAVKRFQANCHSRECGNPGSCPRRKFFTILKFWIPAFAGMTMLTFFNTNARAQNIEGLRHDLDRLFRNPEFSNATFGVAIQSLKTGEYLYRLNATKSLMLASNMKLFTTAEALALLGPEYRYKTRLIATGKIRGRTLIGDVVIEGNGDPTFDDAPMDLSLSQDIDTTPSGWFIDPMASFVASLESKIERIRGSVVGEDSYFSDEVYPSGWQVDDLPYYYAPQVSALAIHGDRLAIYIGPGKKVGMTALCTIDMDGWHLTAPPVKNLSFTGDSASF